MTDPLEYGRIQGRRNASRLSDIHVAAGWNFFNGSFYHGGLNARISIPPVPNQMHVTFSSLSLVMDIILKLDLDGHHM